jgi:hypothetical protein
MQVKEQEFQYSKVHQDWRKKVRYLLSLIVLLSLSIPIYGQNVVVYVLPLQGYSAQPVVVSGYYPVQVYQPVPTYYQAQPLPSLPAAVPSGWYYAGGGVYESWSVSGPTPMVLPSPSAPSYYPPVQSPSYAPVSTLQVQQPYYQAQRQPSYYQAPVSSFQRGGWGSPVTSPSCPSCAGGT